MKISRLFLFQLMGLAFVASMAIGQPVDDESGGQAAQIKIDPLSKARMKFDETTYDFGSIPKGSVVTHNFWLENTGSDTLVVTKITPTCGCTSTRKAGFKVAPGQRETIDIVFDSAKFNGRVTKSIKVESNDPVNPYLDLRFKAVINNPLQLIEYSPLKIDFKNVPHGKPATITVNLTNIDTTESDLVIVEKPSENFLKSTLKNDRLMPETSTDLVLTLGADLESGPFLTSICLEAEGKPGSRITIPISGTILE